MEKLILRFSDLIEAKIKNEFNDKVCIISDSDGSAFDCFEDNELLNPSVSFHVFDSIEKAEEYLESDENEIRYFAGFTAMWINGIFDKSLIYKLRG